MALHVHPSSSSLTVARHAQNFLFVRAHAAARDVSQMLRARRLRPACRCLIRKTGCYALFVCVRARAVWYEVRRLPITSSPSWFPNHCAASPSHTWRGSHARARAPDRPAFVPGEGKLPIGRKESGDAPKLYSACRRFAHAMCEILTPSFYGRCDLEQSVSHFLAAPLPAPLSPA